MKYPRSLWLTDKPIKNPEPTKSVRGIFLSLVEKLIVHILILLSGFLP